jgi:hypothetical protein
VTARKVLVNPTVTQFYHSISRCVRRALLFGAENAQRKQWIEERLKELAGSWMYYSVVRRMPRRSMSKGDIGCSHSKIGETGTAMVSREFCEGSHCRAICSWSTGPVA